jgi:hypothetical protein
MILNKFSGRTFNDASQYPVFPWIIADYKSEKLDLTSEATFRDLKRPMGAMDPTRLSEILEKIEGLAEAGVEPYMYSSGYSCPLHIGLWLLRIEPFTTLHVDIQGGKFDHAARLFASIGEAYRLTTTTHNDYRELSPEFFSSADFLRNRDNYDLGIVDGAAVGDVALPPWARDPWSFVYLQRKALESDYVSDNLHEWIDLIWGYKQSGERAVEANNVFLRSLYADIWETVDPRIADKRAETEALLSHVGQIPPQLFDKPHPKRDVYVCSYGTRTIRKAVIDLSPLALAHIIQTGSRVQIYVLSHTQACLVSTIDTVDPANVVVPIRRSLSNPIPAAAEHYPRRATAGPRPPSRLPLPANAAESSGVLLDANKMVCFAGDGFGFVAPDSDTLLKVRPHLEIPELKIKHRTRIVCVASDGEWTLIADRGSSFSMYLGGTLKFTIPHFTSSVCAAAISQVFQSVVCGTTDCALLFCSLNRGYVTRIVQLREKQPLLVLITKSWGFVCVYTGTLTQGVFRYGLTLFSVNGDQIRAIDIPLAVSAWATFVTRDGFDWIVLALVDGSCYMFEAFFMRPKFRQPIFDARAQVVGIDFVKASETLVCVLANGNVNIVPHELPQA